MASELAVRASDLSPLQVMQFAKEQGLTGAELNSYLDFAERMRRIQSEQDWNQAMIRCQKAMGPIRATTDSDKGKYATFPQLDAALRPLYTANGFSLSFGIGEQSSAQLYWIVCDVIHDGGFSKRYQYPVPLSTKGPKGNDVMTATHAAGSAGSYGQRYLEGMIFNIPIIKRDDDGKMAGGGQEPLEEAIVREWIRDIAAAPDSKAAKEVYNRALKLAMKVEDKAAIKALDVAKDAWFAASKQGAAQSSVLSGIVDDMRAADGGAWLKIAGHLAWVEDSRFDDTMRVGEKLRVRGDVKKTAKGEYLHVTVVLA